MLNQVQHDEMDSQSVNLSDFLKKNCIENKL